MRSMIQGFGYLLVPKARRFQRALNHPQHAQTAVLNHLCDRLSTTVYGRTHGVAVPDDWDRLPIVDYDDLRSWVDNQIAHPRAAILTPDPIVFCEPTSGSRGASKQIPYTRSLRQTFSHLFCIWAHDLICNGPPFTTGKVYFCVSPRLAEQQGEPLRALESASVRSLQDDSDYLDPWLRCLLRPFWVSLPQVHRLRTADQFKHALALTLLSEPRLEIISIWSPSFLIVLLRYLSGCRDRLIVELGDRLSPPRRAALMRSSPDWPRIWPHLKLISCWDSARAADSAESLRSLFPGVMVQGKGLLATEAPMTVPLIQAQGQVPLIDQIFFEFETSSGTVLRLHELEIGQEYGVIVSQPSGLYRYRMGDRIRVTHLYRHTPCLEFLGRTQAISDLVGEKLHEETVAGALDQLRQEGMLGQPRFVSLVPVLEPQPGYVLLLDRVNLDGVDGDKQEAIATALDAHLCQSYHYQQARLLGQLVPVRVVVFPDVVERLTQYHMTKGQVWGDLKYGCLESRPLPNSTILNLAIVSPLQT